MHKAMRRAVGVGGATAVAIAASLALAGVADAHTQNFSTGCLDNGQAQLTVSLTLYQAPKTSSEHNTVTVSYTPNGGTAQEVLPVTNFGTTYPSSGKGKQFAVDGTKAGTFTITVTAWDDPSGSNKSWDGTWTKKTTECPQPGGTPTQPPPTKPTATPTGTPSSTPPSTSSSAPSTSAPAVAPVANQTPPSGGLAYTGVSATLPLIIAGALIIIGAAALIGMRIMKRRRAES